MIASATGRPRSPARAAVSGCPPTATQTGSGSWTGARVDGLVVQGCAVLPGPAHPLRLAGLEEEQELLREELVVVLEVLAEERERLGEGAPADHDLGAAAREQVDGRKVLEHADRVVGAQHGDRARQPDPLRADGRGGEDDRGGRDGEVRSVVLPDPEDVEPDGFGDLDLLHEPAEALLRRDPLTGRRVGAELREGVDTELHCSPIVDPVCLWEE